MVYVQKITIFTFKKGCLCMVRGTTPTICFRLPIQANTFEWVYITFAKQGGSIILEKTKNDCSLEGCKILCTLTQAETLSFPTNCNIEIQIRAKTAAGNAVASNIIVCDVGRILKDGAI